MGFSSVYTTDIQSLLPRGIDVKGFRAMLQVTPEIHGGSLVGGLL
jgi:hypothetical protein